MSTPQTAVIALGSNLENPVRQVEQALGAIAALPGVSLLKRSPLYATAPVGYADQPDFVNAVCIVETGLPPEQLLDALHAVEAAAGRTRSFRNAPRTLDLDIIDYGGRVSSGPRLTLPHPRAHERAFVMRPLADIAPDFVLPGHGTAAVIAGQLGSTGIRELPPAADAV